MIEPRIEELLELLYLRETEDPEQPSPPEMDSTCNEAREQGYLELVEGQPRLTTTGRAMGREVVRRHRLAERLLYDVLQVQADQTNGDACQFEHILRHGLDDRICTLLGHPRTCPHGHPIPPGECCRRADQDPSLEVSPLCDGRSGQEGVVAYLSTRDNREIQKLMALGILPGTEIRLIRLFPSYIFQIGHSQFTVDRTLAEKIFVHWRRQAGNSLAGPSGILRE